MRVLIVDANYGLLLAGMMLERNIQVDAPSSVCRAIDKGKANVERVDRLVQSLGKSINFKSPEIDSIVNNIDYVISSKQ